MSTLSRTLSAPKNPEYGLSPNSDWVTEPVPWNLPWPVSVTWSRNGWDRPARVSVPVMVPPPSLPGSNLASPNVASG